jgi:hypothetical protein
VSHFCGAVRLLSMPEGIRMQRSRTTSKEWLLAAALLPLSACGSCDGSGAHADGTASADGDSGASGDSSAGPCAETGDAPDESTGGVEPLDDVLPAPRLLRRASLALLGVPPTDAQLEAIVALDDEAAQLAAVDAFVADALEDERFYEITFEMAKAWLNVRFIDRTADAPEYGPKQQRVLAPCEDGTAHAGALHYWRNDYNLDEGACDAGSPSLTIEAWWAPGAMVTLVGNAANTSDTGTGYSNGNPIEIVCSDGNQAAGSCGCGPHASSCWLDPGSYPGYGAYLEGNPDGQRRLLAEEPARLFAHLVWHDRPATDLVLGTYSVGPTEVQVAYVVQGIAGGRNELADDTRWWRPSDYAAEPVDPLHEAGDPKAWREYEVPDRNPFFLADRSYHYDPRDDAGPSQGIPAAGMLTSIGFLATYPRERLRAARALEVLACEQLLPPAAGVEFNPYVSDPGREGPCQNCHRRIDPAALHFKRYAKAGAAFEGFGAHYYMPGVGERWQFDPVWRTGDYPYHAEPFAQWNKWYAPDTLMTPVSAAEAEADPNVLFLDYLPPDETLLGQTSDGTVGPLGFAKMIVAAGAFDRCVVRRLHERVMGRDIDPALESGYLEALTQEFVAGDRVVRTFIQSLTKSDSFRRGR